MKRWKMCSFVLFIYKFVCLFVRYMAQRNLLELKQSQYEMGVVEERLSGGATSAKLYCLAYAKLYCIVQRWGIYIYIYEFHTESMRSVSNVFVCVCHADWNFTALNHKRDVKSYLHCTWLSSSQPIATMNWRGIIDIMNAPIRKFNFQLLILICWWRPATQRHI